MRLEYEVNDKIEGKHVMQINIHDSCGHIDSEELFKHMKNEDTLMKYLQSVYPCSVCGIKPTIKKGKSVLK